MAGIEGTVSEDACARDADDLKTSRRNRGGQVGMGIRVLRTVKDWYKL